MERDDIYALVSCSQLCSKLQVIEVAERQTDSETFGARGFK